MRISVIIPTHNPAPARLARTLGGLAAQTLERDRWDVVLIDNASDAAIAPPDCGGLALRVVREKTLGLTAARRRGMRETKGDVVVFVDDDNVLAPDYLEHVARRFAAHPDLGAAGGISQPEFEQSPADWQREFLPLLALRDLGSAERWSEPALPEAPLRAYPDYAPIGAGMALRRAALARWLDTPSALSDRRGRELSSGGDNEIVLSVLQSGWRVAYFPELRLTHLIPRSRLDPDYLARLNHGIQKTWAQVLLQHGISPWGSISPASAAVRQLKAWFVYQAWRSPAARVRWRGACGHFAGRAAWKARA